MFKTPCEIALWKKLPSIRRELVIYLVKDKTINRKRVAELLGITESAISQYLKNKRGSMKFTKKELVEIRKAGDEILKKGGSSEKIFTKYICKLCNCMKR